MNSPNLHSKENEIQIDLQRWAGKLLSYWWLFALSLLLSVTGGYLFLRYATYQYSTKLTLLIKNADGSGGISEESILISDKGLLGGGKSLDDEIQILRSIPLMEKVIAELGANITYYRQGNIKENELYNTSPILLDTFSLANDNWFWISFLIEVKDKDTFTLIEEDKEEESREMKTLGVPFTTPAGYFRISKNPEFPYTAPGIYRISIADQEMTAQGYASRLTIERVGGLLASSILELTLLDPVPAKAEDILNTLIEKYNEEEINDENKVLRNTIAFIDDRVGILAGELDAVEGRTTQFKADNAIITQDAASSMSFTIEEIRASMNQISDLEIQKALLASLEQFLVDSERSFELIPANLSADNAGLAAMIGRYNELALRRDRLATRASDRNPSLLAMEKEMSDIRQSILTTIRNLKQELEIPIAKMQSNIRELKQSMSSVPKVESELVEQMRTQAIKENLFLFLLQKREEAALSAAVTTANTRVIDYARSSPGPVQPRKKLAYLASVLLGLILPLLLIVLREMFETRVQSEEMVQRLTTIPVIGRIPLGKKNEHLVMNSGNRSAISESFRILRTRLHYLNPEVKKSILLITSSHGGEGKTFVSLNLGMAMALTGKKVVLLGLDLRKPKLFEYFGLERNEKGITTYLMGGCELDDIIYPSAENPNLFCIPSGPVLPEFTELIHAEKLEEMIRIAAERFDFVLLDSPPIGLVADALLLSKMVDNTLMLVRQKYTKKVMLNKIEELYQNGELVRPGIVLNGIRPGKGYGSYGNDYGYGYYE